MTAEWMLTDEEIEDIENEYPRKYGIGITTAKAQAKKLLEYLTMYSIKQGNIEGIDCWCIPKSRLIEMRKQLEAK